MAETKNLCAQIPLGLHQKVCQYKDESGTTINQYITNIITEYYKWKEETPMTEGTKTMAIQIPEELFNKLKVHLKTTGKSQKAFIIELIEQALAEK